MSYSCPVTFDKVDTNISRFNTLIVFLSVVTYLFYPSLALLLFLACDFFIKLFINKKYSPVYLIAKLLKTALKIKPSVIDGGAKRLAQYFGLLFMFLLVVTHLLESQFLTLVVASVYLACASLDILFNFCIGCKIYFIVKKIHPAFMEAR